MLRRPGQSPPQIKSIRGVCGEFRKKRGDQFILFFYVSGNEEKSRSQKPLLPLDRKPRPRLSLRPCFWDGVMRSTLRQFSCPARRK